jgi:hypothetical protein
MIEGSGAGSVSVRRSNGSGSGRPKNIRIRNTASNIFKHAMMKNKNACNLFLFRTGHSCTSVVDPDSLEMLDPDSMNPDPQH